MELSSPEQLQLWDVLIDRAPEFAADLTEHFPEDYTADLVEDLPPRRGAELLDRLDSDEQVDVLAKVSATRAEEILRQMSNDEAGDVRNRLKYGRFTAGGLMVTEVLAFPEEWSIEAIVEDLRINQEKYQAYEHRYVYIVDSDGKFVGTIPLRRLLFASADPPDHRLMSDEVQPVEATTPLDDLRDLFDRIDSSVLPVTDEARHLLGVVQRAAVQEALALQRSERFMKFAGVIGGEEFRTMPQMGRLLKRLAFLVPSIVLSYSAVSVIALYETSD